MLVSVERGGRKERRENRKMKKFLSLLRLN